MCLSYSELPFLMLKQGCVEQTPGLAASTILSFLYGFAHPTCTNLPPLPGGPRWVSSKHFASWAPERFCMTKKNILKWKKSISTVVSNIFSLSSCQCFHSVLKHRAYIFFLILHLPNKLNLHEGYLSVLVVVITEVLGGSWPLWV